MECGHRNQLGHLAKVLGGGCEEELSTRAVGPRSRNRSSLRMRLRCMNSISILAYIRSANLRAIRFFENGQDARRHRGDGRIPLAFVNHPAAPWLGLFACQHYRPEY